MKHIIIIETVDPSEPTGKEMSETLAELLLREVEQDVENLHGTCAVYGVFNQDSAIAALHELYGAPKWEPDKDENQ